MEKEEIRCGEKTETILLFIRHGERADHANLEDPTPFNYPIPWDPPLTSLGIEQSISTGKYLTEIIPNIHTRPVLFFASPFTRTMQTIAYIITGIQLPQRALIIVRNSLIEKLNNTWFPLDPQINLGLRSTVQEEFSNEYLGGVGYVDDGHQRVYKFPETYVNRQRRINKFCSEIFEKMEDGTVIICRVHAYGITDFCSYFGNSVKGMKYCSINAAIRQMPKKPKLLMKNIYSPYITQFKS